MSPPPRDFKGVWIPREIWLSTDLTLVEKAFLVEIDSLDGPNGCYASNAHFADFFGLSKGRCTQIIKSLEEKGFVRIDLERQGGRITKRTIRVFRKLNTPLSKTKQGYLENAQGSNTNSSNTFLTDEPEGSGALPPQLPIADLEPASTLNGGKKPNNAARHRIWTMGIDILLGQGVKETHARSFLGKMAKIDENRLAEIIGYLALHEKVDAIPYIKRAITGGGQIKSIEQAVAEGRAHGIEAEPGESTDDFIKRIYEMRQKNAGESTKTGGNR